MRVLFVHGFGGAQGGGLADSFATSCSSASHDFVPVRWAAGALQKDVAVSGGKFLLETLSDPNPVRGVVRGLVSGARDGVRTWDSAFAATVEARMQVLGAIAAQERAGRPFAVVGFSLGCRVLLSALAGLRRVPVGMRRAVFIGAAFPARSYGQLPASVIRPENPGLVHVWSKDDVVLSQVYPMVHGDYPAAGTQSADFPGVRSVELSVGHSGYSVVADQLVQLAVTGPSEGRRSR